MLKKIVNLKTVVLLGLATWIVPKAIRSAQKEFKNFEGSDTYKKLRKMWEEVDNG